MEELQFKEDKTYFHLILTLSYRRGLGRGHTCFLYRTQYLFTQFLECLQSIIHSTNHSIIQSPNHPVIPLLYHYNKSNLHVIYPNPASEKITILLPFKSKPVSLKIFDMEGKCVLTQYSNQSNNSKIKVEIKEIRAGIYILQVQTKNRNYSTKLIINNRETNR